MERIILAGLLLASLIVQTTRGDSRSAAAAEPEARGSARMAPMPPMPPIPPMPPMPPPPPMWLGHLADLDIDVDLDLDDLDHLSLARVVSRELAKGEQETCPGGSVCSFECEGGGCKVDCDGGSVCAVRCEGGRCHNACAAGAVCSLACDGGDCTSTCGEGAICHATDADGHDHVQHRRHPRGS